MIDICLWSQRRQNEIRVSSSSIHTYNYAIFIIYLFIFIFQHGILTFYIFFPLKKKDFTIQILLSLRKITKLSSQNKSIVFWKERGRWAIFFSFLETYLRPCLVFGKY